MFSVKSCVVAYSSKCAPKVWLQVRNYRAVWFVALAATTCLTFMPKLRGLFGSWLTTPHFA
jgi:hypothetical protein